MVNTRDEMRSKIFSKKFKSVEVELFGTKVEIKQPSLGQMIAVADRATASKSSPLVAMMIEYCYVPGTTEKVFEAADEQQILSLPTGAWMTTFNDALTKLTDIDVSEAEKNLNPTKLDS